MLSDAWVEAACAALLLAVLTFAVVAPREWPEAVAAVPAAALVVLTGAVSVADALAEVRRLLPVIGFLAAVLALARLCADQNLFTAAGAALARYCGRRPRQLLTGVFVLAAATTAVLSLDATVVLLTPVVFASAASVGVSARPHVYACAHLANSASLLLPVSNLTNLLALAASGLTFTRFAALMAVPFLIVLAIEYVVFVRYFRRELADGQPPPSPAADPRIPVLPLAIVALTLAGFVVCSFTSVNPAWAAVAGALALAVPTIAGRRTTVGRVVASTSPLFLVFVLALAVLVQAVLDNGLDNVLGALLLSGDGLPALLATAAVAAVLANLINNLPAVLALLPLVSPGGAGPVLAVLIGVNVGPNLTYAGSLATLLWRRVLSAHGTDVDLRDFTRLGLLTVPATLVGASTSLWLVLRLR